MFDTARKCGRNSNRCNVFRATEHLELAIILSWPLSWCWPLMRRTSHWHVAEVKRHALETWSRREIDRLQFSWTHSGPLPPLSVKPFITTPQKHMEEQHRQAVLQGCHPSSQSFNQHVPATNTELRPTPDSFPLSLRAFIHLRDTSLPALPLPLLHKLSARLRVRISDGTPLSSHCNLLEFTHSNQPPIASSSAREAIKPLRRLTQPW